MAIDMRDLRRQADPESALITVPEAARIARVNEDTIRRWLRNGFITASKGGVAASDPSHDRRHWRINRVEFERLLAAGALNTPTGE